MKVKSRKVYESIVGDEYDTKEDCLAADEEFKCEQGITAYLDENEMPKRTRALVERHLVAFCLFVIEEIK